MRDGLSELTRAWREALRGALGDEDTETRIWLEALRRSRGGQDPVALREALGEIVRARFGDDADRILARLDLTPARPDLVRSLVTVLVVAVVLAGLGYLWFARGRPVRDGLYFVLVDRYADAVPDPPGSVDKSDPQAWHGGDIRGVLEHLDDIEALGVGAVWLSPVSDTREEPHGPWGAYHGYWIKRIDTLSARFGTPEDLRALSDALHRRGMRLYLDVVLNHVGPDTPLVHTNRDWFHGKGDITDWNDPVQLVTHDVHGLPDLAQEDPRVYAHLRDATAALIELARPDGLRVDAVRHLPPGFLAELGEELEAKYPELELLGEVFDGDVRRLAERARQDEIEAVFDFPLAFAMRDVYCDGAPLGRTASLLRADYGGARPVTLLDNHDLPRIHSACHGEQERVGQALAFLLTSRGTPSITYGTEIALEGAHEPDNRADMRFGERHPYGGLIEELLDWRSRSAALRSPQTRVIGLSPQLLTVARLSEGETVLVSVNLGRRDLMTPRWKALEGQPVEATVIRGASLDARASELPAGATRIERWQKAPAPVTAGPVTLALTVDRKPPLAPGDRLVVVGAGRDLGDWDPKRGVPLGTDGEFRLQVQDGEILAFKMAVVHEDGTSLWEPHPDRFLLVTSDRWTGDDACGSSCAPAEGGQARYPLAWGDQPLLDAVSAGDAGQVAALLASGADPRAASDRSALELAVISGSDSVVQLLMAAGAPPEPGLLNLAVAQPNDRMLALLINRGIPIDQPGEGGETALMVAAAAGNREAVMRLKAMGADPKRADAQGRTAADHAVSEEIRALLR
jgi:glycosidase